MASRKHSRAVDDDELHIAGKRIKLDHLFGSLHLDEQSSSHRHDPSPYAIPAVAFQAPELPFQAVPPDFNAYIAHKIRSHYTEVLVSKMALIPWYDFRVLVVYRFQRWVVRMFRRFVVRYNLHHGARVPLVRSYDKVMRLALQNGLSQPQLFDIVLQENHREMARLHEKHVQHELAQQEADFKDISYGYWDNLHGFALPGDEEMDWEADSDVDLDPRGSIESNYGSYYHDYHDTTRG
ncbi:uncharacterized protein CANTADRAFT_45916 [Suhomyces tanzawaensis NRRL Y-17324]|uniref:Uncharacterized protein n=1 Tax=Suhomyces tanzawaensis NRRL Y-17324 TaxID=984487 RepID=A0A1E4SRP8_9ASCO|nr:uncharacterized protein CANTADRAFT_45916 [Suhomyces tanzawaensis NRRL Y-17324]ODV82174.1 hypothetical protein CANTADRAFT_45916 [Suhomyces tanzawaensis NRRL Y-17324]